MHSQDIVVALELALTGEALSYADLASALSLSPSQVHTAVARLQQSGLLLAGTRKVNRRALTEFLIHGLKYVFPPERGAVMRGVPTAHSAPPLSDEIVSDDLPVVWPHPEGAVRGESLLPLHRCVPAAARASEPLYHALALIDAIRAGRARERKLAVEKLKEMIRGKRSRSKQSAAGPRRKSTLRSV